MKPPKLSYTGHAAELAVHALMLAWVLGGTFTVEGFAAYAHVPPNRHTRALLRTMVADGILTRGKKRGTGKGRPMIYEAQKTARLC